MPIRVKHPEREKNVRITGCGGNQQRCCGRPGDFNLFCQRLREEIDARAVRLERKPEVVALIRGKAAVLMQIVLRPLRSGNRPLLFIPVRKGAVYIPQPQMHRRAMPGILFLQIVIQKILLHGPAVIRVELREMLQPMDFQILFF